MARPPLIEATSETMEDQGNDDHAQQAHEEVPDPADGLGGALAEDQAGELACQMGVTISSTSAVLTAETGRRPTRGNPYRSMLRHQFCACHRPRQPQRFCSSTRWAASAKVGTP